MYYSKKSSLLAERTLTHAQQRKLEEFNDRRMELRRTFLQKAVFYKPFYALAQNRGLSFTLGNPEGKLILSYIKEQDAGTVSGYQLRAAVGIAGIPCFGVDTCLFLHENQELIPSNFRGKTLCFFVDVFRMEGGDGELFIPTLVYRGAPQTWAPRMRSLNSVFRSDCGILSSKEPMMHEADGILS